MKIHSCKRIDEKLGITFFLDSPIRSEKIYDNLESIISDSDLDVMLIFYCEEPVMGLSYGLKIFEIINISKFVCQVSRKNVFCDIYTDLSFEKAKITILVTMLSSLNKEKFKYGITPSYFKSVDVSKFLENIKVVQGLKVLGEISCVISKENYEEDFKIYSYLKENYPAVIANPCLGEEDWFFKKFEQTDFFYPTHEIEWDGGIAETVNIYSLRKQSNFKGYSCNKTSHVTINLSGPVYFCMTDFINQTTDLDIYKDLPEISFKCDKERCLHEDNVSVEV